MKIGVIGPTDLKVQSRVLGKSIRTLRRRAVSIGKIIAEGKHELYVNSDKGMLFAVGKAYKKHRGKELVVLLPREADPWPIDHAEPYAGQADKVVRPPDWFRANYGVISDTDICVVVGMSLGASGELSYARWDFKFQSHDDKPKKVIVIRELIPNGELPLWMELPLAELLQYIDTVGDLAQILRRVDFKKEPLLIY
ncbi:MAG: hypothetical protein HYS60_02195 [Candidatus Wildermuthbacteria bacterium]|nr:hypothetical protein [Candidatus Wildermuthbacteria bacterium]